MKTIIEGKVFSTWEGQEVTCLKCGGVFQLEQGDSVTSTVESKTQLFISCPTANCGNQISFTPSLPKGIALAELPAKEA